ncbi:GAF domain-containing sensor histidine kinase [Corallococcus sicarius]|uniref:histidine kinase n=1 Tax=Corallococcus sicarius TaxID=2316726 RepID=A0A3A8NP25_9BACT|nr:AAA family ATPase [Corallococcus sicarius]RKH46136.1 GAF domain-containing protein [Corallococcus sicarius]
MDEKMDVLPGYTLDAVVRQGESAVVYRGASAAGRRVIVKMLRSQQPSPRELAELRHAFEFGRELDSPAAVRTLSLEASGDRFALVFEDAGGRFLDELLEGPMEVGRALHLAVGIAQALADLHGHGVIHKDVCPENLVVDAEKGHVQLTDFALASRVGSEPSSPLPVPRQVVGSLPYLSPEQTGRMDRPLDARTDLYSAGVVLYQMLTGQLPFQAEDPLGWIHSHLARTPRPLVELQPHLPAVVSDLVLRLLAKAPEDRYPTAQALLTDLLNCRQQWTSNQRIEPFALGTSDGLGQLRTPQLIPLREAELGQLRAAFERVVATKLPELFLVMGEGGVGKSSLVAQLRSTVLDQGGLFLTGKFDQQQEAPYAAFAHAFQPLFRQLAAEEASPRARWRERLDAALGASGQLIADLIPELLLVTGRLPEVASLPPVEAQSRFLLVFRQLLEALTGEHPVTLFLDDLQWADEASLRLLQHLVSHPAPHPLLIVGACRDRDRAPSDPLAVTVGQLKKGPTRVTELSLLPLSLEGCAQLIGDTLGADPRTLAPLTALVYEKTHGNPFFTVQLLFALHRDGLISFDRGRGTWRWSAYRIRALELSEDVIGLMLDKLRRLPAVTQEALKLAACLGATVEPGPLLVTGGFSSEEALRAALDLAVREGLLLSLDGTYRFLHDRVQQAAYALLEPEARAATHLRIGRQLLAHTPPQLLPERVFTLVSQLNQGAHLIEALDERIATARLNLLAGRRAKAASAFGAAIQNLQAGLALLAPEPWRADHDLAQGLHLEEAESELCAGNLDKAERLLAVLLAHARTPAERASAYRAQIDLHTTRGALSLAIDSASACLRQYGIELSPQPTLAQLEEADRTVAQLLGAEAIEALLGLTPMRDPDMEAAMSVLATFLPTAYFWNPQLHHLVACQMVILTLRHGLTSASTVGLTAYGFELVITQQQYARAARFARVALALVERHGFLADEAKVCLVAGVALLPWVESVRSLFPFLDRVLRAGRRAGDVVFVCLGLTHRCLLSLAAGERLEEVERAARDAADFNRGVGNEPLAMCVEIVQRFAQSLRGRPPAFPLDRLEEAAFAERVGLHPLFVSFWYRFHRLELQLLLGNRAAALAEARQLSGLIVCQRGQYGEAHAVFMVALALAAHGEEAPAEEQAKWRGELDGHHAFLKNLAAVCPANFLAFEALVSAEVARQQGRAEEAMEHYERALRAARASGFLQYAALAGELAASFYRSRGLRTIAEAYLEEAWRAYQEWGAQAKLRQLEQLHPHLEQRLSRVLPFHRSAEPAQLDARAMAHASQVISQEIVLPRLLEKLLRSALEQAGAERGYLMTLEGGHPLVRVAAQLTESGIQASVFGEPVAPGAELPGSLLTHVRRMRQPVLLDDASQPNPFSSDRYFASLRVHSVLCIPLVRQADLAGMLYLENNQLAGAFTSERILTLEVLAAQAAISLENARLYQAAQDAVRVRDDFLAIASHELKTPITAMKLQVQSIRRVMGTRTNDAHTEGRLVALLGTFERQVSRLAYLADEMLDVSRFKAGVLALALELEEFDLSGLVREQVDALTDRLKAAGCSVALEFEQPVVGRWDRIRVGRLVTSLLLNAMKFGAGHPVAVRTRVMGDFARLEVQDRGGGVDRADQARIFERFEQAAPAYNYGGLGLGLYLARETVRAHGGTITVESALGAGATFVVDLPRLK